MGFDVQDTARPSQMTLSAQDFRDVAEGMSRSVLDACRADTVLFSFEISDTQRRATLGFSTSSDTTLLEYLENFCCEKQDIELAHEPGGLRIHRTPSGSEYVFVLIPLNVDGQTYGVMALAISRENWAEQSAFSACSQVARLVSMNLNSVHIRTKLESDLAELNQRTRHLQRQSEIDPLTEVENKASFETRARMRLSQSGTAAALVVIDLDFFKEVNDIYGHQFGDTYLQTIARAVRTSLPSDTLIGRIGGDEFAVLADLPNETSDYVSALLTRLRSTVQRNVALLGKPDLGQMSIGVSLYPQHAVEYSQLFALADSALYESKESDRNVTTIYGDAQNSCCRASKGDGGRIADLAKITAQFQPIIDLKSGTCAGLEALARPVDGVAQSVTKGLSWMFRDHKIAPRLTRHILNHALLSLSKLPAKRRPDLWINLTKFDLLDAEFVFDFQSLLDKFEMGWEVIVVEVHEDVILADRSGQTFHSLQEMRRRGARVALDDFGSGYAGLKHMRDWPIDIIKIDQSFIRDVEDDPHAQVVIEALMMITNSRGIDVVAEGLESDAQIAAIRLLGCRYGQGFVFDPALPEEHLAARLDWYAADAAQTLGAKPFAEAVPSRRLASQSI